jgi:hypothetical protein
MPDPNLRAADSDRAAVAAQLGRHLSDGRLSVDEYDERLAKAYAAKTYGELAQLTTDLPAPTARPAAAADAVQGPAGACGRAWGPGAHRAAWASWLSVAVLVTTIWALTTLGTGFHSFWPIWVIGPWGAVLLSQTLRGGRRHAGHGRGHRDW